MRGRRERQPKSRKELLVNICIGAAGPRFAGKKRSGGWTVVLAYSMKEAVPVVRVRALPRTDRAASTVEVHVLRDDLIDVFQINDALKRANAFDEEYES